MDAAAVFVFLLVMATLEFGLLRIVCSWLDGGKEDQ